MKRELPPGLYSICHRCEEPTLGDLLTPVKKQIGRWKTRTETQWLCPSCRRNDERRSD